MNNQINSRDIELISAYLDNQLGNREREQLEARLEKDPELQIELNKLDQTRSLLRSMPQIRAPRNYYLTPQSVSVPTKMRPTLRWAPAMGIVSAIATILLVVVIFGDSLLSSTTPVALAPEAPVEMAQVESIDSVADQQEVEKSAVDTAVPTEALPMVMMEAPVIETPIPPMDASRVGEAQDPTPTTIYIYAYPPTSTPETTNNLLEGQTSAAQITCEEYLAEGGYPALPYMPDCPTQTPTGSMFLFGILETPTSTITVTIILTPTLTPTPTPTPTSIPSETPSPVPSGTPLPTDNLAASAALESSLSPTETPELLLNFAPNIEQSAPSAKVLPSQVIATDQPAPTEVSVGEEPSTTPNIEFVRYLVLAAEISLAFIAILAGLVAILLRIRAGK